MTTHVDEVPAFVEQADGSFVRSETATVEQIQEAILAELDEAQVHMERANDLRRLLGLR